MSVISLPPQVDPLKVRIILIAEALPENPGEYFYTSGDSLYVTNTLDAFNQAGIPVRTIADVIQRGVYLTVAVKAPRQGLTVPTNTIREHSYALEEELNLFPTLQAILLMGNAAIRAFNFISQRVCGVRIIPGGSTYKIRSGTFYFKHIRVFPSYLQTGKNFLIEKAKQRMVAEDLRNAFKLLEEGSTPP